MKVLIFANGKPNPGEMVTRTLEEAADAYVIAADGGARVAHYYDFKVHEVIGDMDSLSADEVLQLEYRGAALRRFPPEKDESDLELALHYAAERGATWIRVIGGLGGRFDQMLANAYLLALPDVATCDAALVAGKQMIRLLQPRTHQLSGDIGDTVSLIPMGGQADGIVTKNLKYPLNDETLYFGPARGISNVMLANTAEITLRAGTLLCVHTFGRA